MTKEKHKQLVMDMVTKSEEEVNAMCDCGMFNDIIKGYAAIAMKQAGMTVEQIKKADFYHIFDEINAYEARQYRSLLELGGSLEKKVGKTVEQEVLRTVCQVDVDGGKQINTYKIIRMFNNINVDGIAEFRQQVIDQFDMSWSEIEQEGGVGAVNRQIEEEYGVVKW